VLRLYGVAPAPPAIAPLPGPTAPSVVPPPPQPATFARLPVTAEGVPAIPESPLTIAPGAAPTAVAPRAPEDDPIVQEYQRALGDVEARRWDAALAGLERFARAHPAHPYADNAIYWQGEVLYARRDYRRALTVLEALVARYPDGNKVPDALLRIGYCLQRLGDPDRARETFRRVREQYPDTVAARMASREET
jgi:tol-pal system protein YbgF